MSTDTFKGEKIQSGRRPSRTYAKGTGLRRERL